MVDKFECPLGTNSKTKTFMSMNKSGPQIEAVQHVKKEKIVAAATIQENTVYGNHVKNCENIVSVFI